MGVKVGVIVACMKATTSQSSQSNDQGRGTSIEDLGECQLRVGWKRILAMHSCAGTRDDFVLILVTDLYMVSGKGGKFQPLFAVLL